MKKICQICKHPFAANCSYALYCSRRCKTRAYNLRHPRPARPLKYTKICEMCGEAYKTKLETQRFCSANCRYTVLTAPIKNRICLHCRKEFTPVHSAQKYCKDACTLEARRLRKKTARVIGRSTIDSRSEIRLKIKRLDPRAKLPVYSTDGAAGFDLFSLEDVAIEPGDWKSIRLGIAFEIPAGWQIEIRPRSGLSFNSGLIAKNTIGTIDADYRGEIHFCAHNIERSPTATIKINQGDRICQGVLMPAFRARFVESTRLTKTLRGENGFGSTGK